MYNYSFKTKRMDEVYNIDGQIFKEDEEEAKAIFNTIVNYEIEFYKNLRNDSPFKCDVEIFDKDFAKFNNEITYTKNTIRNKKIEQMLKMTDEEKKQYKELVKKLK